MALPRLNRISLATLPEWLPPLTALFAIVAVIVGLTLTLNAVRAILDVAVVAPVEEEARATLPKIDTQGLQLLRPRLEHRQEEPPEALTVPTTSESQGESGENSATP